MYDKELAFEHELRELIRKTKAQVEQVTEATYVSIHFYNYYSKEGEWCINSYGNGTEDITTKGAQLSVTLTEHCRRVNVGKSMKSLPSLIAGPRYYDSTDQH